ncbi:hypothetical protein RHCRD62_90151 [Rhodococcus sp. RD6.2]|nr:hypothetical protein RHCRD62_90151 [Rhodococcus sp. RD6.2]
MAHVGEYKKAAKAAARAAKVLIKSRGVHTPFQACTWGFGVQNPCVTVKRCVDVSAIRAARPG